MTERTPLVNRSDGLHYHVSLIAGPDPRHRISGGFYERQLACRFAYAHDQFGPSEKTVLVVIIQGGESTEVLHQIEAAADELANILEAGQRPTAIYTLKGWELEPGFPV